MGDLKMISPMINKKWVILTITLLIAVSMSFGFEGNSYEAKTFNLEVRIKGSESKRGGVNVELSGKNLTVSKITSRSGKVRFKKLDFYCI